MSKYDSRTKLHTKFSDNFLRKGDNKVYLSKLDNRLYKMLLVRYFDNIFIYLLDNGVLIFALVIPKRDQIRNI